MFFSGISGSKIAGLFDFFSSPPCRDDIWGEAKDAVERLKSIEGAWDLLDGRQRAQWSDDECLRQIKEMDTQSFFLLIFEIMNSYNQVHEYSGYQPKVDQERLSFLLPDMESVNSYPVLLTVVFRGILTGYCSKMKSIPFAAMIFCRNCVSAFRKFLEAIEGNSFAEVEFQAQEFDLEMDYCIDQYLRGISGDIPPLI
ncbi:MAG: hypothetical protein CMO81_06720 [Waddliaceae bacterium]|nr:hypothetical protein [Waddliaceae bacterium]